jgi:hypothetical protein
MHKTNSFGTRTRSKTTTALAGLSIAALLLVVPVAFAQNPHFVRGPDIEKNDDFSLTANFKAAGLGRVVTDIFLTASGGSADLQCVNPGCNNPPPKRVDFGPLEGETVTVTPRNGQVTASPSIGPPDLPGADEICPNPNWSVDIVSLTYTDVELHIQQDGDDVLTHDFGDVDP